MEYEEDFGSNLMIHREYVPRRTEETSPSDIHGIGRSRTELQDMRKRFASNLNTERMAEARSSSQQNATKFVVSTDDNDPVGTIGDSRFMLNEERIKYIERFERHLGTDFRPLAEACAVVFGVDTPAAAEGWYSQFLSLDANSLNEDKERVVEVVSDYEDLQQEQQRPIDGDADDADEGVNSPETLSVLPAEYADFGPLYKNFAAYCKGQVPAAVPSIARDTVGLPNRVAERVSWRGLMERLVAERYEGITADDRATMAVLSERLHTTRLFGAKVGEIVKEIVHLHKAGDGLGASQLPGAGADYTSLSGRKSDR